jgi:arsenite methyltransferase
MALSCPTGFDVELLRNEVRATYSRVATEPDGDYHFNRGVDYAVELLSYNRSALEALPAEATASFAGVGNPHLIGAFPNDPVVLDIGSGAGTDLLLAARRAGPGGRAIGVDMTPAMRRQARENAAQAGLADRVEVRDGLAEDLPLGDSSVDVVISNGVLNLATDKYKAFSEIHRVLRPGGRLHLADVFLDVDLHEKERMDAHLWAA